MLWPASSSPLFPDLPDRHWAGDAVAQLAAKGLIEGYPDGTFKGDRSISRWELAMIVARLLNDMNRTQSTFATRAELEKLRQLSNALSSELDALGVRVVSLEETTNLLDQRVTELERISFYGTLDARFVGQSFHNDGSPDNDSGRQGAGFPGGLSYVNYNEAVGTAAAGLFRPQVNGVLPVMDYIRGRVLSNGTGFTTRGLLGLNIRVNDDIDAGLELVGFSSLGDNFIDGYWGLNAPYTAHPGTANVGAGGPQSLNHQPYTRMVFDRFWFEHKPSKTRLNIGSLQDLEIDGIVYLGQNNTTLEGPPRLNFGFSVEGQVPLGETSQVDWEVFQSRIGSRNVIQDTNYTHQVFGGDVNYSFHDKAGWLKLNLARIMDEAANGAPLATGLLGFNNVTYGESPGWTPFQWVNPPGYFANQNTAFEQANTGGATIGLNTIDTRPIPGWNGSVDNAAGLPPRLGGNYGPQSQLTYGLTTGYRWDITERDDIGIRLDYGRSEYRSNRNSSFTSKGDALRIRADGTFLKESLIWDLSYLRVDPNYNPTRFRNGLVGARFPSQFQVAGAFHAHDFATYPFNRKGLRGALTWKFPRKRGSVWAKGEWFDQTETSLYDVRVTPNALGQATPNFPVIGFSPGFVDYVFAGYAHPNIYGPNSGNSFTADLAPLEDNRGKQRYYDFGAEYNFQKPEIKLRVEYEAYNYSRPSSLSPANGGSQNLVDIDADTISLLAGWQMTEKQKLSLGIDIVNVVGHHDPGGLYNAYANRVGSNSFDNIDSTQTAPWAAFDWKIDEKTDWNFTVRRYDTADHISPVVRAGLAFDTIGSTIHPFDWSGWQVTSTYRLKF
jgi:S-layer family protein